MDDGLSVRRLLIATLLLYLTIALSGCWDQATIEMPPRSDEQAAKLLAQTENSLRHQHSYRFSMSLDMGPGGITRKTGAVIQPNQVDLINETELGGILGGQVRFIWIAPTLWMIRNADTWEAPAGTGHGALFTN